jgi:hypothetical protein
MPKIEGNISNDIKNQYVIKDNTFIKNIEPDIAKRFELEIGDIKQPNEFLPQIKIKRWDNEVNASFRIIDNDLDTPKVTTDGEKIKWQNTKRDIHFYQTKQSNYQEYRDINKGFLETIRDVQYVKSPYPHILINNDIWARDDGIEGKIRQQRAIEASGNVLIVGLGLGLINNPLKENPNVKSITIVEISQEIIDLIQNKYPDRLDKINIIKDDFYNFAKTTNKKFDYIYGDIFPSINVSYFNSWEKFINSAQTLLTQNGKIDGRIKEFYDNHNSTTFEEDVYEFEVILKEKPTTNKIEFTIQTKDLDFFYQPELIPEEVSHGCYRPENIIGSYAVYHKYKKDDYSQLGGNNYQNGKAFHIYRPKIADATGNWVWGELNIDLNTGILTVTIPQEFLDNAVYPVRHAAGLTFGYSTTTGTDLNFGDYIYGSLFTGAAGTATGMSIFVSPNSPTGTDLLMKGIVYLHSNLSKVKETNEATLEGGNNQWYNLTFSSNPNISAVDYVVCGWGNSVKGGGFVGKYDTGSANQGHEVSYTGDGDYDVHMDTAPDPLSSPTHSTKKIAIYVTYTAGFTTYTKTVTAKSSIKKTKTNNCTSKGRIQHNTVTKTLNAKALLNQTKTQTINARSWIIGKPTKPNRIWNDADTYYYYDLDTSTRQTAFRFVPWSNINALNVSLNFSTIASAPLYRVGIMADSGGNPSGTYLGSGTVTPTIEWDWVHATLDTAVNLVAGTTYWIVCKYESGTVGGSNYARQYLRNAGFSELYNYDSQDGDFATYLSSNGGSSWTPQTGNGAIFLINKMFGSPITSYTQGRIYGARLRGQKIYFRQNLVINRIAFYVHKGGTPPNDLTYEIRDVSTNSVLKSGTIADKDNITTSWSRIEAILDSPLTLVAGEGYRFVCGTTGGDTSNYFDVYADSLYGTVESSFYNATYGGAVWGVFQASNDSGTNWLADSSYYSFDTYLDAYMAQTVTAKARITSTVQTVISAAYIIKPWLHTVKARARIAYKIPDKVKHVEIAQSDFHAPLSGDGLVQINDGTIGLFFIKEQATGTGGIQFTYSRSPYTEWSTPITVDDSRDYTISAEAGYDGRVSAQVDSNNNIHVAYKGGQYYRKLTYNASTRDWTVESELTISMPSAYEYYNVSFALAVDQNDRVYISIVYNTDGTVNTEKIGAAYIDVPYTSVTIDNSDIDHYADGKGPGSFNHNLVCIGTEVFFFYSWGTGGNSDLVYWKRGLGGTWGARTVVVANTGGEGWEPFSVVVDKNNVFHIAVTDGGFSIYYINGVEGAWNTIEYLFDYYGIGGKHPLIFLHPNKEDVSIVFESLQSFGWYNKNLLLSSRDTDTGIWETQPREIFPSWIRPFDSIILRDTTHIGNQYYDATHDFSKAPYDGVVHPNTNYTFTAIGDEIYFGLAEKWNIIHISNYYGIATGLTWIHEYWDGSTWKAFTPVDSLTYTDDTRAGKLWSDRDSIPADWESTTLNFINVENRGPFYYIRSRLTAGTLTENITIWNPVPFYTSTGWNSLPRMFFTNPSLNHPTISVWATGNGNIGDSAMMSIYATMWNYENPHNIEAKAIITLFQTNTQTINSKANIGTGITATTQTITAKANIYQICTQSITTKARLQQSRTQTLISKSRIQIMSTQTIGAKSRIERNVTKTVNAIGNIANTQQKTTTSKARISKMSTKSMEVKANIKTLQSKTLIAKSNVLQSQIAGILQSKARIEILSARTITSKGRILVANLVTINAKGRISIFSTQNITGLGRITQSSNRTIYAKANIKSGFIQTVTSKSRLQIISTRTISSIGRIEFGRYKTVESKASILRNTERNIQAKSRVTTTESKTISTKSRIEVRTIQTITTKARVTIYSERIITAKSRIGKLRTEKINVLGRIEVISQQYINALGRITINTERSISANSLIQRMFEQSITSKSRITFVTNQTINAKSNIRNEVIRTLNAKARLQLYGMPNVYAQGNIRNTNEQTVNSKASILITDILRIINVKGRINVIGIYYINAKADINNTQNKTINTKGRIEKPRAYTIVAKSRIEKQSTQTIRSIGRINIDRIRTITAKGSVYIFETRTIVAKASIGSPYGHNIDAKGNIKVTTTHNISTSGHIEINRLVTINAKSRINQSFYQYINAIARITLTTIKTITSKGDIAINVIQNLNTKGRIVIELHSSQTLYALSRIKTFNTKLISAIGNIKKQNERSVIGRGRVGGFSQFNIFAKARIINTYLQTISAKSRLGAYPTQHITAKGDIESIIIQTVCSVGRIGYIYIATISGVKASIVNNIIHLVTAKAKINTIVVIEIITTVRTEDRIKEVTYIKEVTKEIVYNKVRVQEIKNRYTIGKDIDYNKVNVVNVVEPKVQQIKWITARATIEK